MDYRYSLIHFEESEVSHHYQVISLEGVDLNVQFSHAVRNVEHFFHVFALVQLLHKCLLVAYRL
jgi:hypothetical protein